MNTQNKFFQKYFLVLDTQHFSFLFSGIKHEFSFIFEFLLNSNKNYSNTFVAPSHNSCFQNMTRISINVRTLGIGINNFFNKSTQKKKCTLPSSNYFNQEYVVGDHLMLIIIEYQIQLLSQN